MKKVLIFIFFAVLLLSFSPRAFAEKINSFDVSVTAHKNGLMDISEKINYDFEDVSRHGIYRYIPLYSKVGDLFRVIKISNVHIFRDGKSEDFSTSTSKEQVYFKIGNANRTMSGAHVYEINYSVENGVGSNFPDHDEVYWNATGNGWDVDIDSATETIDTDFGIKPTKFLCFTGVIGSKTAECEISGNTAEATTSLYPSYGLTAVAAYPVGTFPKSILYKELPKTFGEQIGDFILKLIPYFYLFMNVILPILIIFWYLKHKNKSRFGKPSVSFEIPKDENGDRITPAEAGTIDTARLDKDDVTATIFDLAIRKYIKLEQTKKTKALRPDETTQIIIKLKESDDTFTDFEQTLFDRLFEDGDSVDVKDLRVDFYSTFGLIEDQVFNSLVSRGYYLKNPKLQRSLLAIGGTFALFTLFIPLAIVLFFLSRKLIGRTGAGDEVDFKIDGLKLFLKSMDRNYKWQAGKFYTVEQMIPYAMALGYIDEFMQTLKIIKPNYHPSWYSGYSGSFYASYALFSTGFSSNITTSAPSSSSGSGGGGFSGGGGGGGGGGSW